MQSRSVPQPNARRASAGRDAQTAAYDHCWRVATAHYENFTLGSWLLPRELRRHIAALYAFARGADDLADEGSLPAAERLARLDDWERSLEDCVEKPTSDPVFLALADTIVRFDLPLDPFRRLLRAFRMDVEFRPFPTYADLREYCRCSADPVGHLILYLFGYRDRERQELADGICTGLQLANFWQDLAIDAAKGRLYVPLEDLERFGCTRAEILGGILTAPARRLLAFQVERARAQLSNGLSLADRVDPGLAREVRLFAWGGLAILGRIEEVGYDVFRHRPTISRWTKLGLIGRALLARNAPIGAQSAGVAALDVETRAAISRAEEV